MVSIIDITFVFVFLIHVCVSQSAWNENSDLRASRSALMKSLGLKRVPRNVASQSEFLLRRYSAPKFMMGLFREVNSDRFSHPVNSAPAAASTKNSSYGNVDHYEIERKYLDETKVDTVISFFKYDHDKSWNRIHKEFKIKFKTNFNSQEDIVKGGELKLFKRGPRNRNMTHELCSVAVYLITAEEKPAKLLDKREVHAWKTGWQTFNITDAIRMWAVFPQTNYGLKVVVHHIHEELSPSAFGIVGTRGNLAKRPYIIAFVATTRVFPTFSSELLAHSRDRRDTREKREDSTNNCKLKKFYVSFKEIGLDGSIIAPKGYEMSFCQGLCVHPFDAVPHTSHAIVQSLYHLYDSSTPEPCCVPGRMKSENLLFFDNDKNIVLKQHPDMTATSCACN